MEVSLMDDIASSVILKISKTECSNGKDDVE